MSNEGHHFNALLKILIQILALVIPVKYERDGPSEIRLAVTVVNFTG